MHYYLGTAPNIITLTEQNQHLVELHPKMVSQKTSKQKTAHSRSPPSVRKLRMHGSPQFAPTSPGAVTSSLSTSSFSSMSTSSSSSSSSSLTSSSGSLTSSSVISSPSKRRGIAFFYKPRSPVKIERVMASVIVGKTVNGVTLTEIREMDQCPKAESARSRVVATNSGPKHQSNHKDMKAIKSLINLRVRDPKTPFFTKGINL